MFLKRHHLLTAATKDLEELCKFRGEDALEMEMIKYLCAPTSSLNRLLRVCNSLNSISSKDSNIEEISAAFKGFTLALSAVLKKCEERVHITTDLLPAIESFFLMYKLRNGVDEAFAKRHGNVLNILIRKTPKLLFDSMSRLTLDCPYVLELDNKRTYFTSQLHKDTFERRHLFNLHVTRSNVLDDSLQQVMSESGEDFRNGWLNVDFAGEEGDDLGGLTREWFSVLTLQIFNPHFALFCTSAEDTTTYAPNHVSSANPDHLHYFRFVGRVIAKAIVDGQSLDVCFTRSFYKCILGRKIELTDLEAADPQYYNNLLLATEDGITELTFSMDTNDLGVAQTVDLVVDGRNLAVTEDNQPEFLQRVAEYRLVDRIKHQIGAFLTGFSEVIPLDLMKIFDEQELELLISGQPDINVDDWQKNTKYQGYTVESAPVQWFWKCVRAMPPEKCAKMLQFVTGSSRVPLGGFGHLQGNSGLQNFQIHCDVNEKERLPRARTCFNKLFLPEYDTYEILRDKIEQAINECSTGFGLA